MQEKNDQENNLISQKNTGAKSEAFMGANSEGFLYKYWRLRRYC